MIDNHDTITAIATPIGTGSVGIVRISGSMSLTIAAKLHWKGRTSFKPYHLTHAWIKDSAGHVLDEVLMCYMPGPGSYTGEDVIEINCHGNPAILEAVLEAAVYAGARQAEPGEFTKRAFLNGKMDLTEAEAVLELINAPTRTGVYFAGQKLQGGLGRKIANLRQTLEELRKELCLTVDFPEEELECISPGSLIDRVRKCIDEINILMKDYEQNRIWSEGVTVALAGCVNAGKSSLMNAVLGRERAIVTDVPGTTRDYIEEMINVQGLPVKLVDTAGFRDTDDMVELKGLEKGREIADSAGIVMFIVDSVTQICQQGLEFLKRMDKKKIIIALNKWDLVQNTQNYLSDHLESYPVVVKVSAKTGHGLDELIQSIRKMALKGQMIAPEGKLVPNLRQMVCLNKAVHELDLLVQDTEAQLPFDLLSVRLDYACSALDEITGRITPDEVLNSIFDNFCIGK
ncbi:tRNA uridine-5-carboxymethylaminomethyl(34) synthesis GTPase MnmE [Desulfonatronovibrio magnus]|uniref:tRNA uridine-5-carboxymethylaminomethyl(34) synthesis GTPase MnmE n=1 Tax=Desulfonatronovibrio magnus TaxID=698827 RepID=UPI0005EAE8C5|nr:tRNA uridine-5-carboxymethylaminomethyl(34) synthesis GTPase MnmE [Desulfonatronovibrio magnus]